MAKKTIALHPNRIRMRQRELDGGHDVRQQIGGSGGKEDDLNIIKITTEIK